MDFIFVAIQRMKLDGVTLLPFHVFYMHRLKQEEEEGEEEVVVVVEVVEIARMVCVTDAISN